MAHKTSHLDRRHFLRAVGVSVALPMLESMRTYAADAGSAPAFSPGPARRIACIGADVGYYRPAFYPKQSGSGYETSELLKYVDKHRADYTVFSGLDHRAGNGHAKWENFLCGPEIASFSLDQQVAERTAPLTRIPSFQLMAGGSGAKTVERPQMMCYSRQGVPLPLTGRPSVVYKKMFSSPEDQARTGYLIRSGRSALDTVLDEAKHLQKTVSAADQLKLDEYFNSVREVEKRMTAAACRWSSASRHPPRRAARVRVEHGGRDGHDRERDGNAAGAAGCLGAEECTGRAPARSAQHRATAHAGHHRNEGPAGTARGSHGRRILRELHRDIDPFGFVLESHDPIGRWRTHYPGPGGKKKGGPAVDSSGTLPNGTELKDVTDLKLWLVEHPELFSNCLSRKLLTYATGRRLNFRERWEIEQLVKANLAEGNPFHDLMLDLVDSAVFRAR